MAMEISAYSLLAVCGAAQKKNLTDFINDWAFGVNNHSMSGVVGCYDMNGLLWGTFAKELREETRSAPSMSA